MKLTKNKANNNKQILCVLSGIYTAPVSGIYVFNLYADDVNNFGTIHITAAGNVVCRAVLSDYEDGADNSSCTAIIKLFEG